MLKSMRFSLSTHLLWPFLNTLSYTYRSYFLPYRILPSVPQ